MNYINELSFKNKKDWVWGLMIHCPFGKALKTCPAKDIRVLPLEERLKVVNQMEESQIDEIIAHHKQCLKEREGVKPQ